MSNSTMPPAGLLIGGGPLPRTASITVTHRHGEAVTVATWDTCHGVADFISSVLGTPGARVEAKA